MHVLYLFALLFLPTLMAAKCKHIPLISGSQNRVCDSDLTASSEWGVNHGPSLSRLHTKAVDGTSAGAWCAQHNQINQWIQVDFKKIVQVTDIATQGRNSPSWPQWVKSYEIQYSTNGGSWTSYKHGSVVKRFVGNVDPNSVHTHHLHQPFNARFVRLIVKSWHLHISMRWEIYGCAIQGIRNCDHDTCVKTCNSRYLG